MMDEFHGFLLFFSNVSIAYRGTESRAGWSGWGGTVGGDKDPRLGHPWSSHDVSRHPHNGSCHNSRPQRQ